jgi:hypothetical protein
MTLSYYRKTFERNRKRPAAMAMWLLKGLDTNTVSSRATLLGMVPYVITFKDCRGGYVTVHELIFPFLKLGWGELAFLVVARAT